jgi:hypothetical protein
MPAIILALITSGSVSSLAGAVWTWVTSRRKARKQVTIRLRDGQEISIGTDDATPEQIEAVIAKLVEADAGEEKSEPRADA